jgi:hypothetical protein
MLKLSEHNQGVATNNGQIPYIIAYQTSIKPNLSVGCRVAATHGLFPLPLGGTNL